MTACQTLPPKNISKYTLRTCGECDLSASADQTALIDAVITIKSLDLPLYPRPVDVAAALTDCQNVMDAAAAYIRARMEAVERHTGFAMNAAGHASDLTGIFADSIRPQFYAAERAIEDAEPARAARAA